MAGNNIDQYDESVERDGGGARSYIGIHFECCGVYARLYRRAEQKVYQGNCPRCLRQVRVQVGPGGTSQRIFRAR